MAILFEQDEVEWQKWLKKRPPHVRAIAEKYPPNRLYRLKTTGHRVTVYSLREGKGGAVTMTVNITAEYNLVDFERQVFGIDPNDLEECDLPAPGEPLGCIINHPTDLKRYIKQLRAKHGITIKGRDPLDDIEE